MPGITITYLAMLLPTIVAPLDSLPCQHLVSGRGVVPTTGRIGVHAQ
jgi:hypothetical protein